MLLPALCHDNLAEVRPIRFQINAHSDHFAPLWRRITAGVQAISRMLFTNDMQRIVMLPGEESYDRLFALANVHRKQF